MKTAVDTIFIGRDRAYNRRFQQMCGHYLVDPVACTPASGWEKGQVENQVGVIRRRFFVPRPRFKSYAELNAWLLDRCVAWAKAIYDPLHYIPVLTRKPGALRNRRDRPRCLTPMGKGAVTPQAAFLQQRQSSRKKPSGCHSRNNLIALLSIL